MVLGAFVAILLLVLDNTDELLKNSFPGTS